MSSCSATAINGRWRESSTTGVGGGSSRTASACRSSRCGLGHQRLAARLELEQDGLRRLTGEPELLTLRIEPDAVSRHRQPLDRQKLLFVDDREVVKRRLTHDDRQAAEPAPAGLPYQFQGAVLVRSDHCGGASTQGGSHGTLISRRHVQMGQHKPMPGLGKSPGRGRNPLALGQRALQRAKSLAHERRLLAEPSAFHVGPRRPGGQSRPPRLLPQRVQDRRRALAPQRDALGRAAQPVEGRGCGLTTAGRIRELLLRSAALQQEILELRLASTPRVVGRGTTFFRRRDLLVNRREIEEGDCRLQSGNLPTELFRPLRRSRLEGERPQTLPHLRLDVACARHVLGNAGELELGAMTATLEPAEPGGVLDQRAALLRLRGEDLLDLPLRDHGASGASQTHIGEQLDEIGAADGRSIDQVLPFTAAMQPPHDRDLGERQVGERAVLVVQEQLHLAKRGRRTIAGAREEDVIGLLCPQLAWAEAPRRPQQRVGDVGLPRTIGPHDYGDARLEANLDRIREGLEAADADRAKVHAAGTLVRTADGAQAARIFSSACLAASCSAAFLDGPIPTPAWSPSITAAEVNFRSWGGPSTSRTA